MRMQDLLGTPDPARTKVKFNMNPGDATQKAWDLLLDDDPEWLNMNRWRKKRSSNDLDAADYLLAFAQYHPYGPEYYIFGGGYRIVGKNLAMDDGPAYDLAPMPELAEFEKRLIIKLAEPIGRNLYCRHYEHLDDRLRPEVCELAPATKLGPFPGYQNVRLRHSDLVQIVEHAEPAWQQALSQVKAIYVIADLTNGSLYVGSASGSGAGLWQRWTAYAHLEDPTGGNRGFADLVERLGAAHIRENFQYAILEIFDMKTKDETVLEREQYWKLVLDTRSGHGLNRN